MPCCKLVCGRVDTCSCADATAIGDPLGDSRTASGAIVLTRGTFREADTTCTVSGGIASGHGSYGEDGPSLSTHNVDSAHCA
jgi:hypothetical protein